MVILPYLFAQYICHDNLPFDFRYGKQIFHTERPTEMNNNHIWFNRAVTRWLDIALYKAMQRILKVEIT